MKKRKHNVILPVAAVTAIIAAILVIIFVILPSRQPKPLTIAAILPLSGYGSDMVAVKNGMDLAVEKVNRHGGINGQNLRLVVRDNQSDTETSTALFQQIEEEYKPILYTTAMSSFSLALGPLAEETQVPLICQVATNPRVTYSKQWVFSFFPTAEDELPPILSVVKRYSIKRLALLYHEDPYGIAVFKELKEQVAGEPISLEAVEYRLDTTDFSPKIRQLQDNDALYAVGYTSHLKAIFHEARGKGSLRYLLGPSTASTPGFRDTREAEGIYVAAPIIYKENYKFAQRVSNEYRSRYTTPFNHYAATGYEFINIVSSLLENIDVIDRDVIRTQLSNGFIYPGLFGDAIIKKGEHIIRFPLYPAYIENGELDYSIKSSRK